VLPVGEGELGLERVREMRVHLERPLGIDVQAGREHEAATDQGSSVLAGVGSGASS
jgi:hypothetical protein